MPSRKTGVGAIFDFHPGDFLRKTNAGSYDEARAHAEDIDELSTDDAVSKVDDRYC